MPLKVYTSSAGSGKTYTLVREYLLIVLANPYSYRHILAITFTNKATDEMKSRIVEALARLAAYTEGSSDDPKTAQLARDLLGELRHKGITAPVLQQNAQKALYLVLHHYGEFSVSTIDSFFQKILRHFAKELKIPIRYELEMSPQYAIEQVVARLMTEIGKSEGLTDWLERYTFAQMDDEKGWNIERNMAELGKEIFKEHIWDKVAENDRHFVNETTTPDIDDISAVLDEAVSDVSTVIGDEWAEDDNALPAPTQVSPAIPADRYETLRHLVMQLQHIKREVVQTMNQYVDGAHALIARYGLKPDNFKSGSFTWFAKIKEKGYEYKSKALDKILGGDTKEWRTQKSEHRDKIDQAVAEGLQDLLCESVAYYQNERTRYLTAIEALKSIYSYGILGDVHEKLKDYRSENNTMLMADVTNLLRAIISKDDAPFIFEKVGTTYQHLLVDEFQDTSDFQWLNLLPLVRNSLGTEQNVLVVGDAKQSIYRWRGGNMKLLLNDIREQLLAFFDAQTEQNLANNYRSHARIIEFNNAFFTTAAQTFAEQSGLPDDALHDLRRAYDTVQQGIVKSQGGYVEIAFMEGEGKDTDQSDDPSDTDIATLIGKGTTKTWQQAAANYLLTIIEQAQQDGFAYSDIAILVRGNVEGSQIAQLLAARHIRVISSESLLLNTSPKVQLLLSALHLIADRRNHIARAELIVNYCQLFPNTLDQTNYSYHQLCTDHRHYLNQLIAAHQADQPAPDDCPTLLDQLLPEAFSAHLDDFAALNLYDCIESLLQALGLTAQADAYLQRFQDLALTHTLRKNSDLRTFLAWWKDHENDSDTSIVVPKGENAITIMTIHKAKGLEFPIVILPLCQWKLSPKSSQTIWAATTQAPFDQFSTLPLKHGKILNDTFFAHAYQRENAMTLIDNLNVLYVAFTRPTQRLYVMTQAEKKPSNSLAFISKLLYDTLRYFAYAEQFDIKSGIFAHGKPDAPTHKTAENTTAETLQYPISRNYTQAVAVRNDEQRYAALLDPRQAEAIRIGTKAHLVLEKLKRPQDIDKTLRQLQTKGLIDEADISAVHKRVSALFDEPKVREWFDPQLWDEILCEQTILKEKSRRIPDRILLKGKKAILIDYKTGKRNDEKYSRQLNHYAQWLKGVGYTVTEKYLLYIGEQETEIIQIISD